MTSIKALIAAGIACSLLWISPGAGQTQTTPEYFATVDSMCQFPPIGQDLEITCQKKIDRWYVSFVGVKGEGKARIAAVTLKPLADPKEISLSVQFKDITPTIGAVTTWGYIFDRNRDGKVDYLALIGGAAGFKPDDFPEDYPSRPPYTRPQLELFVSNCRLVFDHWGDDNFDGNLDAAVHIDMDSLGRDWVDKWIVARSMHHDDRLDDAWSFRRTAADEHVPVAASGKGVPYRAITKKNEYLTGKSLGEANGILNLINKAAKACKLTGDSFFRPEEKE
jgi:hypothetical protein